jgi:hypothetical protein
VHVKIQVYIELLTYEYIHGQVYTVLRANRGPGTEKYRRKYCTFEFIFKIMLNVRCAIENLRIIYEKIRETVYRKNTGNPLVRKSAR